MNELISRHKIIKAIDKFIPADPMNSDYTQGISVGLALATRCIEEFSQETDEYSQGLVKDLISRQDAKDVVDMELDAIDHVPEWVYDRLLTALDKVPSAQPELAQNLHTACTDAISRQDAIDAFWKLEAELRPSAIDAVLNMLKNLPSAQPERKKGKWLRSGNCIFPYECDQCGDTNERATSFCPNCGAKMEEENV